MQDRAEELKRRVAEAWRNAGDNGDHASLLAMDHAGIAGDMIAYDDDVAEMAEEGDDMYDKLNAEIAAILPAVIEEHKNRDTK
jgi:hypothetical protein